MAGRVTSLPSPLAPLSPSPPLGGATSSAESVRHHIRSNITVRVSILPSGAPFAVAADQTLAVSVKGDYFLTIAAPLLGVEALPGSDAVPGLRSAAIVWEGFNPGRRTLKARAKLDPARAAPLLPLRIELRGATTTFVNTTGVTVDAFSADTDPAPLERYVQALRRAVARGLPPPGGVADLTSATRTTRAHVAVPLHVEGSIGGSRISTTFTDKLRVHRRGRIDVVVEPEAPRAMRLAGLPGREALASATTFILTIARLRQYERFLANPDPAGASTTAYVFRTAVPPKISVAIQPAPHGRDWTTTIAIAAGVLVAAAVGLALWTRA